MGGEGQDVKFGPLLGDQTDEASGIVFAVPSI